MKTSLSITFMVNGEIPATNAAKSRKSFACLRINFIYEPFTIFDMTFQIQGSAAFTHQSRWIQSGFPPKEHNSGHPKTDELRNQRPLHVPFLSFENLPESLHHCHWSLSRIPRNCG